MKKLLWTTVAMAVALAVVLPAHAEGEKKASKPRQYTGLITALEDGSLTVKKKDEEKTFAAGEKLKVVVPGKEAGELSDLKVGDKVTVHFKEDGDRNVAVRIVHADTKKKGKEDKDE